MNNRTLKLLLLPLLEQLLQACLYCPPLLLKKYMVYGQGPIACTRADQLLPLLLMDQFDTFPIQCRPIEHMHEGVWFRKNIF